MKKLFSLKSMAVFGLAVASLFASCSSDNLISVGVDDPAIEQNGIKATVFDGIYTVKVKSNGNWKVSLPEDCEWATILNESGSGDDEISVVVESNCTGVDRAVNLTLSTDNETKTIALNQSSSIEGVAGANGPELISKLENNLGYGCDLMEFIDDSTVNELQIKSNAVINSGTIKTIMENDKIGEYSTLIKAKTFDVLECEDAKLDSVISKKDSLGITIDVQVAYGLMKFGLSGDYVGRETFGAKTFSWKKASNFKALEASAGLEDIIAVYQDVMGDSSIGINDPRRGMLAPGFALWQKKLEKACASSKKDDKQINKIVRSIINKYGTGVVSKAEFGGLFAMEIMMDSTKMSSLYGLNKAQVTADIKAGLFSLKANAEATYNDSSIQVFKRANHKLAMRGGKLELMTPIIQKLDLQEFDDTLANAITKWAKSIVADTTNFTAVLLSAQTEPIWALFSDEASEAIQNYLLKNYPKSKFVKKYIGEIENEEKKKE